MSERIVKKNGIPGVESDNIPSVDQAIAQARRLLPPSIQDSANNLQGFRDSNRSALCDCHREYRATKTSQGTTQEISNQYGYTREVQLATSGVNYPGDRIESHCCIDWGIGRPPGLKQEIPPETTPSTPVKKKLPGRADLKILMCERVNLAGTNPCNWKIYSSFQNQLLSLPNLKTFMGTTVSDWRSCNLRNTGLHKFDYEIYQTKLTPGNFFQDWEFYKSFDYSLNELGINAGNISSFQPIGAVYYPRWLGVPHKRYDSTGDKGFLQNRGFNPFQPIYYPHLLGFDFLRNSPEFSSPNDLYASSGNRMANIVLAPDTNKMQAKVFIGNSTGIQEVNPPDDFKRLTYAPIGKGKLFQSYYGFFTLARTAESETEYDTIYKYVSPIGNVQYQGVTGVFKQNIIFPREATGNQNIQISPLTWAGTSYTNSLYVNHTERVYTWSPANNSWQSQVSSKSGNFSGTGLISTYLAERSGNAVVAPFAKGGYNSNDAFKKHIISPHPVFMSSGDEEVDRNGSITPMSGNLEVTLPIGSGLKKSLNINSRCSITTQLYPVARSPYPQPGGNHGGTDDDGNPTQYRGYWSFVDYNGVNVLQEALKNDFDTIPNTAAQAAYFASLSMGIPTDPNWGCPLVGTGGGIAVKYITLVERKPDITTTSVNSINIPAFYRYYDGLSYDTYPANVAYSVNLPATRYTTRINAYWDYVSYFMTWEGRQTSEGCVLYSGGTEPGRYGTFYGASQSTTNLVSNPPGHAIPYPPPPPPPPPTNPNTPPEKPPYFTAVTSYTQNNQAKSVIDIPIHWDHRNNQVLHWRITEDSNGVLTYSDSERTTSSNYVVANSPFKAGSIDTRGEQTCKLAVNGKELTDVNSAVVTWVDQPIARLNKKPNTGIPPVADHPDYYYYGFTMTDKLIIHCPSDYHTKGHLTATWNARTNVDNDGYLPFGGIARMNTVEGDRNLYEKLVSGETWAVICGQTQGSKINGVFRGKITFEKSLIRGGFRYPNRELMRLPWYETDYIVLTNIKMQEGEVVNYRLCPPKDNNGGDQYPNTGWLMFLLDGKEIPVYNIQPCFSRQTEDSYPVTVPPLDVGDIDGYFKSPNWQRYQTAQPLAHPAITMTRSNFNGVISNQAIYPFNTLIQSRGYSVWDDKLWVTWATNGACVNGQVTLSNSVTYPWKFPEVACIEARAYRITGGKLEVIDHDENGYTPDGDQVYIKVNLPTVGIERWYDIYDAHVYYTQVEEEYTNVS